MPLFKRQLILLRRILLLAVVSLSLQVAFPQHATAATLDGTASSSVIVEQDATLPVAPQFFPQTAERDSRYTIKVLVTAYSSSPDQTDSTPFITASGDAVFDGIVAANWLPFGAHVRLEDNFGDKVFVVKDRMNNRFSRRLDIWMPTREQAQAWGQRYITVEVL